ncbi:MAG: cysteine desulfurase-like protein [Ilumatobacteraceae bacterium]|nr:cysteine desulfurase-like protein [Ilumatobacteraceae bacterium]
MLDLRHRFPAVTEGTHAAWARFDGPAGTQVVDSAIQATTAWQRSGNNANSHGAFAAAQACDDLAEQVRGTMGELLHADPYGFIIGPSTTSNIFSLTRAIARGLGPGDEIICTQLDHDSNVSPWLLIAADTGATIQFAEFDPGSGRLPVKSVTELLNDRTRWVAVTGASNAIGTMPDVTAITAAAHEAGAQVVVDGVHLTPHAPVDLAAIGCDIYSTSSYKWYGPHAGITWVRPELLDELPAYKVRPAPDTGAERFQLGTPAYENLAAIDAAARFLIDTGMAAIQAHERGVFQRLLDGLAADERVTIYGPHDLVDRAPTLAFNVAGFTAEAVATALAAEQIAVWDGNYYALEAMDRLGIDGAVRAGIALYVTDDDVDRLVDAVGRL